MANTSESILLLDNGSLRAAATLQLRELSEALSGRIGKKVHAVSLLHSSKVNPEELNGEKAQIFVPFLRKQREEGVNRFIVVPLFFGPSGALVDYLPKRVNDLREEGWTELEVEIAPTLCREGDLRIAEIMATLVRERIAESGWKKPAVAMCDHGTPAKAVNEVRELVAQQLTTVLGNEVSAVTACSMERRDGEEYAFNEPLLENLLGQAGYERQVVISMLFAGPGRHAGANGDVAEICAEAGESFPRLETSMTALVGSEVEKLVAVLADRYGEVVKD
jgi:sirohydrochlorin ferrochelatase